MKILVTGATGFIGRHLLPVLLGQDGQNALYAVARSIPEEMHPGVNWVQADLEAANWSAGLPDEEFDVVIHLAQSRYYREFPEHAADIVNVNVCSTIELAGWAIKHKVRRFVFASTGSVYGSSEDKVHVEDGRCNPETMYGASKLTAEILLKPYSEFMHVLVPRLFGIYGPGQADAMLPAVMQRYLDNAEITLAGGIGVRFNPLYVEDCASALCRLAMTPVPVQAGYDIVNVGGDELVDLCQVSMLLERFGNKATCALMTSDNPKYLIGSVEKFHKMYQFSQLVPFQDGLRRTFDAYRKRGGAGR